MSEQNESREHHSHFQIIVNGEQKEVDKNRLTFHEVCLLAFPNGPFGENITYTVTYTYSNGRDGSLVKGESVEIENGMIFNVGNTDKS